MSRYVWMSCLSTVSNDIWCAIEYIVIAAIKAFVKNNSGSFLIYFLLGFSSGEIRQIKKPILT